MQLARFFYKSEYTATHSNFISGSNISTDEYPFAHSHTYAAPSSAGGAG